MAARKVRVEMLVSIAGHADPQYELEEFSLARGREVEIHYELARAWVACGHAPPADLVRPVRERAVTAPGETRKGGQSTWPAGRIRGPGGNARLRMPEVVVFSRRT